MRIVEYRPRHARLLADLWNESDEAWPTGLVRLRPMTPQRWRELESRIDALGRFVALDRGRAVGYVRLFEWFDSPDASYVQWLNVHPRYHGKGIGKELLHHALERTIALGYPRVDLHTWPGNEKAMPLYKRSGYMWVPGSHAYLQNYLPLLLAYEPARSFFARSDWYRSLEWDLTRDHDEDRLHGIDAFVYRFRDGRRRLEATIDRGARGVAAFEDSDVRVEAWIPDAALVETRPGEIRWSVRNKSGSPVSVAIEAGGPAGLHVENPPPFVLRTGASRTVVGRASIPDSFPDTPTEWASPAIETTVVIAGRVIRLRSGFRPKPPLRIAWEEDAPHLTAAGSRRLGLIVRNQAGRPVRGDLAVAGEGLRIEPAVASLRMGKGSTRRLRFQIENPSPDDRAAHVRVRFESPEVKAVKTLVLPCLTIGGRVAYAEGEDWKLVTPSLRLVSAGMAGTATLHSHGGTKLFEAYVSAGPPFWPSDAWSNRWEGRAETVDGVPQIVRRFHSRRREGMVLEQRWRLVADDLLEFRGAMENGGSEPWVAELAMEFNRREEFFAVTMPTAHGPVTEALMESEWPDEQQDVPLGRVLSEGWLHAGAERAGYGIIWGPPGPSKRVELSAWSVPAHRTDPVRIAPGERKEFPSLWVAVGPDWHEVRRRWAHIAGREASAESAAIGSLRLDVAPSVAMAFPAAELRITLRNDRLRPFAGVFRIEATRGLRARPARKSIRPIDLDSEARLRVRVAASRPLAGPARFVLADDRTAHGWDVPVVGGPSRGALRMSGPADARRVDNGRLAFTAARGHSAALVSLSSGGHEYLVSSFPHPGSWGWFRPFYGGIQPFVYEDDWPGNLYRDRFRVSEARRGLWRGPRLSTRAKRSSLPAGTVVTAEYMTRPGTPLVLAGLAVRNASRERHEFTAGFWTFLGLDGTPDCAVEFDRLRSRSWRTTSRVGWSATDEGFAVFGSPRARNAVAVCAAKPADLEVFAVRRLGHHGVVQGSLDLEAGETGTVLAGCALVPPREARGYRALRTLTLAALDATRPR